MYPYSKSGSDTAKETIMVAATLIVGFVLVVGFVVGLNAIVARG